MVVNPVGDVGQGMGRKFDKMPTLWKIRCKPSDKVILGNVPLVSFFAICNKVLRRKRSNVSNTRNNKIKVKDSLIMWFKLPSLLVDLLFRFSCNKHVHGQ